MTAWVLALLCACAAQAATPQEAVEAGLKAYVAAGGVPGLEAALITPKGLSYMSAGVIGEDPKRALDEHTIFAVASISKLFTTLSAADLQREGKLSFGDTASSRLPKGKALPEKDGKAVTLAHLATHTSGIPAEMGTAVKAAALLGWGYALGHVYQKPLESVPGSKFVYNNLGMALLGHIAELVDGRPYEELVQERVLKPLGMHDTWISKPSKAQDPVGAFRMGIYAPAGGFNSSTADLAKFAAAALGGAQGGLKEDFAITFEPQGKDAGGRPLHLGWHEEDNPRQLNHTGRNNIYLGIDLKRQVAMVISCTDQTLQIGALGHAALATLGGGKAEFPKPFAIIQVPASEMESYAGEYKHESAGTIQLKVDAKRGVLLIAFGGKGESVLWPGPDRSFHCKEWKCDLSFAKPESGKSPKVTISMDNWSGDYARLGSR